MRILSTLLFLAFSATYLPAASLTIGGFITQSTPDGTGPAGADPSLNNILDGQAYTLTLQLANAITGPGLYNLTGSPLSFAVPSAPATESNFGTISLNVATNGAFSDFSLLACVGGANCSTGNALSASFRILTSGIAGTNIAATGLDQPHPLDLLEDDGITDIHGSITTYSAVGVSAIPEPSSVSLFTVVALGSLAAFSYRNRRSIFKLDRLQKMKFH